MHFTNNLKTMWEKVRNPSLKRTIGWVASWMAWRPAWAFSNPSAAQPSLPAAAPRGAATDIAGAYRYAICSWHKNDITRQENLNQKSWRVCDFKAQSGHVRIPFIVFLGHRITIKLEGLIETIYGKLDCSFNNLCVFWDKPNIGEKSMGIVQRITNGHGRRHEVIRHWCIDIIPIPIRKVALLKINRNGVKSNVAWFS